MDQSLPRKEHSLLYTGLSFLGGLLVLLQMVTVGRWGPTAMFAGIFLGLFPGEFLGGAGVLLAFLAMAGALLKWTGDMVVGDLVVVLSSAFSLIVGGGFFIGCVLGLVGGFMGYTSTAAQPLQSKKWLASDRSV